TAARLRREHAHLPSRLQGHLTSRSPRLSVVLPVIVQMTALAHGTEVGRIAVLRHVIKVRGGQHDFRARAVRGLAMPVRATPLVPPTAAFAYALTPPPGPILLDGTRNLGPVGRVTLPVLLLHGHECRSLQSNFGTLMERL